MELNKPALQAATGAFMERLTDKPTTGDLLAALRFALEAYESVRPDVLRQVAAKLDESLTSRAQRTDKPS